MTFSDADAQRLLRVVDEKIERTLSRRPYTTYGVVESVDAANRKASVYTFGNTVASEGFSFTAATAPAVGEMVRVVIDPRGDRYIEDHLALSDSELAADTAWSGWPLGSRQTVYTNGTANGMPTNTGLLVSWNVNEFRSFQVWLEPHMVGAPGRLWYRSRHTTGITTNGGWSTWNRLDRGMRFTALGTESVPYNSATQSGNGTEISLDPELTAIPANLPGKVYASGRMLVKHSTAPASSGQYIVARHWSTGTISGLSYALSTSQWASGYHITELGGTNNRQIDLNVHAGASGTTLTFHFTVTGYWTTEA